MGLKHKEKIFLLGGIVSSGKIWIVGSMNLLLVLVVRALFSPNPSLLTPGEQADETSSSWECNMDLISRWREGKTGVPIVDAIARELISTGYISNRARQLTASALSLSLRQDWRYSPRQLCVSFNCQFGSSLIGIRLIFPPRRTRYGASHFEAELVDYDVASNWVNWMIIAGGSPKRTARFNIVRQAKLYDPEGSYVRRWIPELAFLPNDIIHEPWKYSSEEIVVENLSPSSIYLRPIIPYK